jgi:RNA polymerase sigma-70 factor, ECF subfamily
MVDLKPRPPADARGSDPPVESSLMALTRVAAGGDERATRELLEVIGPRVRRVVRVILGAGNPDVDDVMQLALIAITQALPSFRGECEPTHYASRIAARTAVHAHRRASAMRLRHDDLVDAEEAPAPAGAEGTLAERHKQLVRDLLGVIPHEQAEALTLRIVLGWSLDEIATASNTPLNTVRSRLRLAKEALRRRIESDPILREELGVPR